MPCISMVPKDCKWISELPNSGDNDALKCDNKKSENHWYQRDCGDTRPLQNRVSRVRVFLPLPGKHLISYEIGCFSLLFGVKCFIKQENDALLQQRESIAFYGFLYGRAALYHRDFTPIRIFRCFLSKFLIFFRYFFLRNAVLAEFFTAQIRLLHRSGVKCPFSHNTAL